MRLLLDGNLPRAFGALLPGHRVQTVHQRRWSDLDDGPLLRAAEEAGFDAFLTMDQSLRFQQNLRGRALRIVVLRAHTNKLADLVPLAAPVLAALPTLAPGEVRLVGA
jgi:predicted nuclease of predicted toxin-antitoxin system